MIAYLYVGALRKGSEIAVRFAFPVQLTGRADRWAGGAVRNVEVAIPPEPISEQEREHYAPTRVWVPLASLWESMEGGLLPVEDVEEFLAP